MRCAEAQELLQQGHSWLYFNAPSQRRDSPYSEEVDQHSGTCPECGQLLIRLLYARLKRVPGPIHWLQVHQQVRRIRQSMWSAAIQPYAEEGPIIRIANTILQQAIKENAGEISLVVEPSSRPFRPDVAGKTNQNVEPESQHIDLLETTKRDIASIMLSGEGGLRVCVSYKVGEQWHDVMAMPAYIAPPLWARFKSMADLLLTLEHEPQNGRIPIRYENKDYNVTVRTTPDAFGETLQLSITPSFHGNTDVAA